METVYKGTQCCAKCHKPFEVKSGIKVVRKTLKCSVDAFYHYPGCCSTELNELMIEEYREKGLTQSEFQKTLHNMQYEIPFGTKKPLAC